MKQTKPNSHQVVFSRPGDQHMPQNQISEHSGDELPKTYPMLDLFTSRLQKGRIFHRPTVDVFKMATGRTEAGFNQPQFENERMQRARELDKKGGNG
ncbi:MAG: hypothetical protein HRT35_12675 [Algicola sp.]|nr:hypothetical protein [Algicola sp.]